MAKKLNKKQQEDLALQQQRAAAEQAAVSAISGGGSNSLEAAVKALEDLRKSEEETARRRAELSREQQAKTVESLVTRAISGGTEEDVTAAVQALSNFQAVQPTAPVTSVEPVAPASPLVTPGPTGPVSPTLPVGPTTPLQPTTPLGPTKPLGPTTSIGTETPTGQAVFTASDGTRFLDIESRDRYEQTLANKQRAGQSAFALLQSEFNRYGMGSLIEPLKKFIKQGLSRDELVIELRNLPEYKQRFAGNEERVNKGLRALSEAEYIALEDQYQDIMRRYGLPESYYKKETMGRQPGFEKLIASDVSAAELEERVMIGQRRLNDAPPEVKRLLSDYYAGVISNGDALAYVLDPKNALEQIQRKVTAAEIGAGAAQAGLTVGGISPLDKEAQRLRAEELVNYGITGAQARQGFQTVAEVAPRGGQLAEFYKEEPYTQRAAEAEVFGTAGAVEARKKREKLTALERSAFSGTSGMYQGALSRDRAGGI